MKRNYIENVLNVGCTGRFHLTVGETGEWSIVLSAVDGIEYYTDSKLHPTHQNILINEIEEVTATIPEWMMDACVQRIEEMKITLDRGAILHPKVEGARV